MYYVLALLAIYGVVLLRRRGRPLLILLAPIVMVTLNSALSFGTTRFRLAAEIPLVVLAAVAIGYFLEHRRLGPVRLVEMERPYGPAGPSNSQSTRPRARYSNRS
jgi:asparagine N-glycosylation enzyme membrane subunit Stt3